VHCWYWYKLLVISFAYFVAKLLHVSCQCGTWESFKMIKLQDFPVLLRCFCWLWNVLESSVEICLRPLNLSRFCCRKRWWRCWWWQLEAYYISSPATVKSKSSSSKSKSLIAVCTSSKKSMQYKMAVSRPSFADEEHAALQASRYNTSRTIRRYTS